MLRRDFAKFIFAIPFFKTSKYHQVVTIDYSVGPQGFDEITNGFISRRILCNSSGPEKNCMFVKKAVVLANGDLEVEYYSVLNCSKIQITGTYTKLHKDWLLKEVNQKGELVKVINKEDYLINYI